jgi:sigma-E factor negative regulatory protein RseC
MSDMTTDTADVTGRHMAEGFGRIVAVEPGFAWVEVEPTAGCGTCAAKNGCGVPKAANAGPKRRLRLQDHFGASIGDRIVVGIPESALLNASALTYAAPLIGMIGAALAADALGGGDLGAALAAVAGLAGGILFGRMRGAHLAAAGRLSPVYIRHATDQTLVSACAFTDRR